MRYFHRSSTFQTFPHNPETGSMCLVCVIPSTPEQDPACIPDYLVQNGEADDVVITVSSNLTSYQILPNPAVNMTFTSNIQGGDGLKMVNQIYASDIGHGDPVGTVVATDLRDEANVYPGYYYIDGTRMKLNYFAGFWIRNINRTRGPYSDDHDFIHTYTIHPLGQSFPFPDLNGTMNGCGKRVSLSNEEFSEFEFGTGVSAGEGDLTVFAGAYPATTVLGSRRSQTVAGRHGVVLYNAAFGPGVIPYPPALPTQWRNYLTNWETKMGQLDGPIFERNASFNNNAISDKPVFWYNDQYLNSENLDADTYQLSGDVFSAARLANTTRTKYREYLESGAVQIYSLAPNGQANFSANGTVQHGIETMERNQSSFESIVEDEGSLEALTVNPQSAPTFPTGNRPIFLHPAPHRRFSSPFSGVTLAQVNAAADEWIARFGTTVRIRYALRCNLTLNYTGIDVPGFSPQVLDPPQRSSFRFRRSVFISVSDASDGGYKHPLSVPCKSMTRVYSPSPFLADAQGTQVAANPFTVERCIQAAGPGPEHLDGSGTQRWEVDVVNFDGRCRQPLEARTAPQDMLQSECQMMIHPFVEGEDPPDPLTVILDPPGGI